MASKLRRENHLPTIRIGSRFEKGRPLVRFRTYRGQEARLDQAISADAIGIVERSRRQRYGSDHFQLDQQVIRELDESLERDSGEPLWLQVDRAANYLALVPWERLLRQVVSGPILRVPNFLVQPRFASEPLVLALCVSSPRAKQSFMVHDCTAQLVQQIQQVVQQGTEIHVFADADAHGALAAQIGNASHPGHAVVVHDPQDAAQFGEGGTSRRDRDRLTSPWLLWIRGALDGQAVDALHCICPGFVSTERGFLALARSPLENEDRHWSHFVGAPELRLVLDELGIWSVTLGAPYKDVWAQGLRLLANELAWTRPGPVVMYDDASTLHPAIEQVYAFLYSVVTTPPPDTGDQLIFCHPRRLSALQDTERGSVESPTATDLTEAHEWLQAAQWAVDNAAPPQTTPASEPLWLRSNRMVLEQAFMEIGDREGASGRGASDAIQFLSQLHAGREPGDA